MPKEYTAIRDSLEARGKTSKVAKRIAAATYNKRHPNNPNPWAHESGFAKKVKRGMRKRR